MSKDKDKVLHLHRIAAEKTKEAKKAKK